MARTSRIRDLIPASGFFPVVFAKCWSDFWRKASSFAASCSSVVFDSSTFFFFAIS